MRCSTSIIRSLCARMRRSRPGSGADGEEVPEATRIRSGNGDRSLMRAMLTPWLPARSQIFDRLGDRGHEVGGDLDQRAMNHRGRPGGEDAVRLLELAF